MPDDRVYAKQAAMQVDTGFQSGVVQYPRRAIMPYPSRYVIPWKLRDGITRVGLKLG